MEVVVIIFFIICIAAKVAITFEKNAQSEGQERRIEEEEYESSQLAIKSKAQRLVSRSKSIVNELPNYIQNAERKLNEAETEFRERAFAPFWDAVESAINNLGYFDEEIQQVVANSEEYKVLIADLDNERPAFLILATNFPDACETSDRMRRIVRQAQKDFQFSTIYEQRKTNKILVAGFGSLAEAISNMSYRIEDSIACLSDAVSISFENQNELLRDHLSEIKKSIDVEGQERREHEEEESEILDNIQRRRKPLEVIPNPRDGNWEKN